MTDPEVERFIQSAIERGEQTGPHRLDPLQRTIFLLSELEVYCDKDGIDSFLGRYGSSDLRAVAALLRDAGAAPIADSLARIADALPRPDEGMLSAANHLVSNRAGYDHAAIARVVASRLAKGSVDPTARFADRFLAATYERDEVVRLDCGDPALTVTVPERLFARAQGIARAYELHLLPTIDIYKKTRLNPPQCQALLDEVALVAMVSSDDLLREHLERMQGVISTCVRLPQRELLIVGP